jgi:hypothetical protein
MRLIQSFGFFKKMQINLKKLLTNAVRRCKILPMQSSIQQLKKVLNMTDVNYTPEMVATIEAAQPLDLAKAKALGAQLDRGYRSIIAKAKREGFEYISKPAPARKKAAPSKAELVGAIAKAVDCDTLDGLEKATGQSLAKLLEHIA